MAKLVDPTCAEIRELSEYITSYIEFNIRTSQAAWQYERGAEGYKNLSDCPPENVNGQYIWLLAYIQQGIEALRHKALEEGKNRAQN